MKLSLLFLAFPLSSLVLACGGHVTPDPETTPPGETIPVRDAAPPDAPTDVLARADACIEPLESYRCPASYDDALQVPAPTTSGRS